MQTRSTLQKALTLAGVALVAACSSLNQVYLSPTIDEPHAVLVFRQTDVVAPGSVGMASFIGETDDINLANSTNVSPGVSLLGSRTEEGELRVRAGNPVFLHIITDVSGARCRNFVTFTPEAGERYIIDQPTWSGGCRVRIKDVANNATPRGARYFKPIGWPESAVGSPPTSESPLDD